MVNLNEYQDISTNCRKGPQYDLPFIHTYLGLTFYMQAGEWVNGNVRPNMRIVESFVAKPCNKKDPNQKKNKKFA